MRWNEAAGSPDDRQHAKALFRDGREAHASASSLVGSGHGTGGEVTDKADKEIAYDGKQVQVSLGLQ